MIQLIRKRPLPFLLALFLLCGVLGFAGRGDDPKYSRLGGEALAIALYEDLLAQFPAVRGPSGEESRIYACDYGGAYLGEDKRLVICSTTRFPSFFLPRSREYVLEQVPYSLNELKNAAQAVSDSMFCFRSQYDPSSPEYGLLSLVNGVGTDQRANRVYIMTARELTEEEQELFASLFTGRGPGLFRFEAGISIAV